MVTPAHEPNGRREERIVRSCSGKHAPRPSQEGRVRALLASGEVDRAATEALRGHGPEVLRYLRALLGDEVDAREAFSAFAERFWRGLGEFRGEASLRTWAFRLAWNAACDLRRDAWRARRRRLETGEASALAAPGGDGTRSWLRLERRRLSLAELREALTPEEQTLLHLRIDRELSWAACAEVLSAGGRPVSEAALMKRFERIKARLAGRIRAPG